ncbi:hypothetical protein GH714_022906 [Hevea brasiliensis]|uniref:Myb/SANT-like domain-containing protein n=1 Tax=Hevea brasiliensis TaxID=3981 RepID=A0A6A6NIW0_HEVBR|nr:hypothetical protein GH714_022906 [Hevea brasiliensis]
MQYPVTDKCNPIRVIAESQLGGYLSPIQESLIPKLAETPIASVPRPSIRFQEAMGVRARNGNDRLRTIWTPEMDRFFIGLLLEQIHPDARAYRIKTIPYYKDLCLIYGDTNIEEKGDNVPESLPDSAGNEIINTDQVKSVSEGAPGTFHEITVDENYSISVSNVVIDDSASKDSLDDVHQATGYGTGSTGSNRTRTYWQPPMDRYFIDLMLEHMRKGNQIDGVFRKQAWMDMITSFNAKFGFNYDVDVLKNRYKTLRGSIML